MAFGLALKRSSQQHAAAHFLQLKFSETVFSFVASCFMLSPGPVDLRPLFYINENQGLVDAQSRSDCTVLSDNGCLRTQLLVSPDRAVSLKKPNNVTLLNY